MAPPRGPRRTGDPFAGSGAVCRLHAGRRGTAYAFQHSVTKRDAILDRLDRSSVPAAAPGCGLLRRVTANSAFGVGLGAVAETAIRGVLLRSWRVVLLKSTIPKS